MNKILFFLMATTFALTACSPKTTTTSSKMQALTVEAQILEKSTKINSLNVEIEKQRLEVIELTREIKLAADGATVSANKASDAATEMKNKVGDIGKAATADIYAETASKDAHKVYKLNSKLSKINDDTSNKQKQVELLNKEIEALKATPPNPTNN